MFANRYTALVDACSLADAMRRNLLLSLAEAEFFRVRWSEPIMDETERAIARIAEGKGYADAAARGATARMAMERAFVEASVAGFEPFLPVAAALPDPGDHHVLAAALKIQAQTIITENLRDFPEDILAPLGIEARSADDFIADTIALDLGRAVPALPDAPAIAAAADGRRSVAARSRRKRSDRHGRYAGAACEVAVIRCGRLTAMA